MWGFQPHFQGGVERDVRDALSEIGLSVEVRVVLVGFALDEGLYHQICVEPETGPLSADHLVAVARHEPKKCLTLTLTHKSSTATPGITSCAVMACFDDRELVPSLKPLRAAGAFQGMTFFVSDSAPIDNYEVHTCVGVPTAALGSLPALDDSVLDRVYVGRSLQHEVIAECLRRADRALYLPDPGAGLFPLGMTEDIIKAAAEGLTNGMAVRATGLSADLFVWVNAFTSLSYERAGARGHIIIASSEK